ncbi:YbaB/EbfC family nucleoid-associated protein [Nocardia sp. JW2]|uniref:YbaB/EbfC family nucleoid-associated protein n=1 Tax=Nocardia sp. JW2 TaxID=3450738 RepID=UPI003F4346CF
MNNEAETASLLVTFSQQISAIAEAAQKRALLTGTGITNDKRVTVTMNADGAVIETKFSSDIDELTYDEIAKAVTTAAQRALADVGRQTEELMQPIADQRAAMPKLHELIDNLPDLDSQAPTLPAASMAPPNSPERVRAEEAAPTFDNAEDHARWTAERRTGVTDSGW